MNARAFGGHISDHQKQAGFTLIEVMVVTAIFGIFVALAGPSFGNTIAAMRIKSTSFDLVNDLNTARSEAIKRNAMVVIAAQGNDWTQGWSITTGSVILKSHGPVTGFIAIAPNATAINFLSNGRPADVPPPKLKFEFSINSTLTGVTSRCVQLEATGSARSLKEACKS